MILGVCGRMAVEKKALKLEAERFGRYLQSLRAHANLRQSAVGAALQERVGLSANWQPMLARIEAGAADLKPEYIKVIADICEEPLENVAAAFLSAYVFDRDPPAVSRERADAARLGPSAGPYFISDGVEIWSLEQLLRWEAALVSEDPAAASAQDLWIVAPNFQDHVNSNILQIVVENLLMKGVHITYFAPEQSILPDGNFDIFIERVVIKLKSILNKSSESSGEFLEGIGKISFFGLNNDQLVWFTSSMIISDPAGVQDGRNVSRGFLVVPYRDQYAMAVPMSEPEIQSKVSFIGRQIEKRTDAPVSEAGGSYREDVLRHHAKFQRIFKDV